MSHSKKQSFLHGAALLAMATVIVKLLGALYKLPLNAVIGKQGFSYFNTAYDIYTLLMLISTAGLPVAMSRMISEANSMGNYRQMRRIYSVSKTIFLSIGIFGSLLMTVFARPLANWMNSPNSWAAIACLGPSALLVCVISPYRGFFQGQSNMIPTSVSQVIEAVCKLVIGLVAAYLLLRFTRSVPYAAAGAILGVTIGCLMASLYLFAMFRPAFRELPQDVGQAETVSATVKKLLAIAIPITLGSAGLQLLTTLEIKVYMGRLLSIGFTQDQADGMKGIYNMSQTIFNLPCSFIPTITVSAIPAITAQLTLKKHQAVRETEESASRITALIAMPCAVGLFVMAEPIMALLGKYTGEDLVLGTRLMAILGICVIFNSMVLLTNGIMQAHGHVNLPVINMFIGGILKLIVTYILTGNPAIAIVGTPISSVLCFLCITTLNLIAMRRVIQSPPAVVRNMFRPMFAALIMGAAAYAALYAVKMFTSSKTLACAVPIAVGGIVYLILAVMLKAITRADCELLPKGEKIAKILHL